MKYLIMCEGTNEKTIIKMLLEYKKLIFTEDDLINLEYIMLDNLSLTLPVK